MNDILNEIEQEEFNFQTDGSFGNVSPYLIIEYNEAKEKFDEHRLKKPWFDRYRNWVSIVFLFSFGFTFFST